MIYGLRLDTDTFFLSILLFYNYTIWQKTNIQPSTYLVERYMANLILKIICSFLLTVSCLFIFFELRTKFDRAFLYFGISNLLLCSFCAIDIWIQPESLDLQWTRFQHLIISFFPAFLTWYLFVVADTKRRDIVKILFFIAIILSLLFYTDLMLVSKDNTVATTLLYNFLFAPFILGVIIGINWFIIRKLAYTVSYNKRVLVFHLVGIVLLSIFSMLDMVGLILGQRSLLPVASGSVLGVFAFALITTVVFAERLAQLVREREATFEKLKIAYHELDSSMTLRELGKSTSIINHEIKNYTYAISGFAKLAEKSKSLDENARSSIDKIIVSVNKLHEFSQDILDFSKSRLIRDKVRLDIGSLIESCIENHFSEFHTHFRMNGFDKRYYINGDWNKLEHVFLNVIKNSVEANARAIVLSLIPAPDVLVVTIEDDGVGCTEEQLENMFKAFYTTKRRVKGSGLGMAIVRSIVESHGGHINCYSKNLMGEGEHGLKIVITFPYYRETEEDKKDKKDNIIFVKDGIEDLTIPFRIFQNISLNPYIVQNISEITTEQFSPEEVMIFGTTKNINRVKRKFETSYVTYTLISSNKYGLYVIDKDDRSKVIPFTEDFVISCLDIQRKRSRSNLLEVPNTIVQ